MPIYRRHLLGLVAVGAVAPALARAATPQQTASWETPRALGSQQARNVAEEFFSLTCTHCAAFARETFPQVEKDLIDTGKLRWVFRDFPLDRVALQAAMVARALPPDRYAPFVLTLFATQDRWAFASGVDSTSELRKMAALAGLTPEAFDAAANDTALRDWILAEQAAAEKKYGIDATPTFIVNGQKHAGEMGYAAFSKLVPNA